MELSRPGGGINLFPASFGAAVVDVVEDSVVKQNSVLRDDTDCSAQAALFQLLQIESVNLYAATGDVIKSVKQAR